MPEREQVQMVFAGVNAVSPPHVIKEDEVQASTNIDFSLERGAASCRRGCAHGTMTYGTGSVFTFNAGPLNNLYRHYNKPTDINASPVYAVSTATVFRGVNGTYTAIQTGVSTGLTGMGSYRNHCYIASGAGTKAIKDDGTSAVDWVKQSPTAAPTFGSSITLITDVVNAVTGTYTLVEGSPNGATHVGTATVTATVADNVYRAAVEGNADWPALLNIGDFGYFSVDLSFSNPSAIKKISQYYSVADSSFAVRYEASIDIGEGMETPNAEALLQAVIDVGTSTVPLGPLGRLEAQDRAGSDRFRTAEPDITESKDTFGQFWMSHAAFRAVGGAANWSNIPRVKLVIEADAAVVIKIRTWQAFGSDTYPLSDLERGYAWWETWATLDASGNIEEESSPSPPTVVKQLRGQRQELIQTQAPTGNHGITHRVFYRQGGLLPDPYRVGTLAIASGTFTDTMNDMEAITQGASALMEVQDVRARSEFPNNIVAVSEPFHDRIFVAYMNKLAWSLPGRPGAFPRTSESAVSHQGDEIQALHVWADRMVVVNRDSVYEMIGDTFEDTESDTANWVLARTGCRHGSKAPRVAIKTPYGIPLLDYDGLSLYMPGQGVDQPIEWAMERMADVFRGTDPNWAPGPVKGNRMPQMEPGNINLASAAFADGKLYLALPCNGSTYGNYVFVLDFRSQQVWVYDYPFDIASMLWDPVGNQLLVGSSDGAIMRLEWTSQDAVTTTSTTQGIPWFIKTRAWTTPSDTLIENLQVEYKGGTGTMQVIVDGGTAGALGTMTSSAKDWIAHILGGGVANNLVFQGTGTQVSQQQNVLYAISWDALPEPPRVQFWRTEHKIVEPEGLWDVHYADLEGVGTGTILGAVYVDNTAVMTNTIASPTGGRVVTPKAFPTETYGEAAYTIYTVSGACYFKHWDTRYGVRQEPPRVNSFVTDREDGEERRFDAVDFVVNPNGTMTGVLWIDNVATSTLTATGTTRQSFTRAVPTDATEKFGRTAWVVWTGTAFKHYGTWYHTTPEPDRLATVQAGPFVAPANEDLRTWIAVLNPLGTATGILYADDTALTTATFTGTTRQPYNVGLDVSAALANQTGKKLYAVYGAVGAGALLKHYDTKFETTPKPFGKTTWSIRYKKVGGATQLDLLRFWSIDAEPVSGTATVTCQWDVDGSPVTWGTATTTTLVFTGREWKDRLAFPPGQRSFLAQLRLLSNVPIQVFRSSLDVDRTGIKGLSRISYVGTPNA